MPPSTTTTTTTTTTTADTNLNTLNQNNRVLIAGAGPSGLLLALLLSQHSIPSLILESHPTLDTRLRATQYGVPATRIFAKAGLLPDIRARSIESFPSICWRKTSTHEKLVSVDLSVIRDEEERMTILPLNQLVEVMYEHAVKGGVEVRFGQEVVGVGEGRREDGVEEGAWVDVRVQGEEGVRREWGRYVAGCDGSKSAVRKALFGGRWSGETFDCHLLVQNVWYDGFEKHGWDGGNYMIDPDYWGLIAKRGKGGLWRVTYGDVDGLTIEEYEKRREVAFEKMLPGHPKPGAYKINQTDHFRTHNRCVDKMRVGRILLAGDAAHVNNPWGGYGCMAAVLDAGGLADCLIGVYEGKAGDEILDLYAEIRRDKFINFIDERSRRNFHRVRNSSPDEVLKSDKLMKIFQQIEGDSQATKDFLLKTSSIEYDFTQHYRP